MAITLLALGLSAIGADAMAADAKKDAKPAAPALAWITRCDKPKEGEKSKAEYCEMVQRISVTEKGGDPAKAQRLVEFAIGYPPAEKDKATAVIILPLGILVQEKIKLEIDGDKETDFEIGFCEASGCIATVQFSEREMGKLAKGKVMRLLAVSAVGQPVAIDMPLGGFAEAYQKIKPAE